MEKDTIAWCHWRLPLNGLLESIDSCFILPVWLDLFEYLVNRMLFGMVLTTL